MDVGTEEILEEDDCWGCCGGSLRTFELLSLIPVPTGRLAGVDALGAVPTVWSLVKDLRVLLLLLTLLLPHSTPESL